jgi:hypothetical protein
MSVEAELQELRRQRRNRRIAVVVACVAVLIAGVIWLNSRNGAAMTCREWQTQYTAAVLHGQAAAGTQVNLEQVRPEGCPAPLVPAGG